MPACGQVPEEAGEGVTGRRKPYTDRGISRVPCSRCGKPSVFQWNACANGHLYVAICTECDIALNKLVLEFMRIPDRKRLMREYTARLAS